MRSVFYKGLAILVTSAMLGSALLAEEPEAEPAAEESTSHSHFWSYAAVTTFLGYNIFQVFALHLAWRRADAAARQDQHHPPRTTSFSNAP